MWAVIANKGVEFSYCDYFLHLGAKYKTLKLASCIKETENSASGNLNKKNTSVGVRRHFYNHAWGICAFKTWTIIRYQCY